MRRLSELMDLSGRAALVTGGAGHIGAAVADGLGELGARIAVVDRDAAGAERVATEIAGRWGHETIALSVDLEREAELRALPERVRAGIGQVDVLVNCAAFVGTSGLEGWTVPFEDQSSATWRRCLEVNLTASFILVQALLEDLRAAGRGSVVNVGSIYGLAGPDWRLYKGTGLGNPAAYAASKGGLHQLTRWLATTLAPAVRVNAVAPGGVFRDTPEPFLSRYIERTPLGRMAGEEDLKGAVAYLASDLSAYVTGQCLVVDGGWTVW